MHSAEEFDHFIPDAGDPPPIEEPMVPTSPNKGGPDTPKGRSNPKGPLLPNDEDPF